MKIKYYYDRKHQSMYLKIDDYVCICLHHEYDNSTIAILDKKLSQQYVKSFKIIEKIERLIYKLDLL